jgi:hypothetical protein
MTISFFDFTTLSFERKLYFYDREHKSQAIYGDEKLILLIQKTLMKSHQNALKLDSYSTLKG